MGVIIRQSLKGSIVTYIGAIFGALTTIVIFPYYLTPEFIGLTRVLIDASTFLAFFAQIGIPNAIVKYNSKLNSPEYKRKFIKLLLVLPLFGFVAVSAIFLFFKSSFLASYSEKSNLFNQFYFFLFPFSLFCIYLAIFETYNSTLNRVTVPRIIREIGIRTLTIISILVYVYLTNNIVIYVIILISIYGFAALLNIYYSFIISPLPSKKESELPFSSDFIKEIGTYMFFMFSIGIGSNIVARIDTLMISSMVGLEKTGIYSIAFFIATIIEIPSRITLQISGPIIAREMKNNNFQVIKEMYKKNSLNQAIIGGFLLLIIWINIENIFNMMPNGELYKQGGYVVLFIGLAKLIDAVTGMNNLIVVYSKQYKYLLIWICLLSVATVIGNLIFIPLYGITGAALGSLIGYFSTNITTVYWVNRKYKMFPFDKRIFYVLFMYLLCLAVNVLLPKLEIPILDVMVRSFSILLISGFIIFKSNISLEINYILARLIDFKNFFKFINGR